jgi:CBS domain-containing protein
LAEVASAGEPSVLLGRVGDLLKGSAVTVPEGTPVREAARLMASHGIGSVLVTDAAGAAVGIVTDRDLRTRVLAAGRDPAAPVREIMSAPLHRIGRDALALEALLEMTRWNIHHLAVVDGERLLGVVSSTDFVLLEGTGPVALSREIERQPSLEGLQALLPRVVRLVARLAGAGVEPGDIGRIVAELNDRIVQRVLGLSRDALAASGQPEPPVAWAWLALGSEGRREQTLVTDQDNALVYADAPDAATGAAAAAYFRALAENAVAALIGLGFPPCAGGWMASNPRWCQPLRAWLDLVDRWVLSPDLSVLAASVFFDLRAVAGDPTLATALWERIVEPSADRRLFLRYLARDAAERASALGLLGRVRTDGRGRVDVKRFGTFPLVGAARVLALDLGLGVTNTVERLHGLVARAVYREDQIEDLGQAYGFLLRVRLRHQLEQLAAGIAPDNLIEYRRLSRAERLLLRDAFRTTDWVRSDLRDRYQTDLIA